MTRTRKARWTRREAFGADILRACVEVGGVLTGEHGVGVEKRDLMPEMFTEIDLDQQQRVKCAFDDKGLLNPGKVFPTAAPLRRTRPHACACRQDRVSRIEEGAIDDGVF
jgi:glycolate oxidase